MAIPRIIAGRRRWLLLKLISNGFAQAGVAVATALLIRRVFDQWINGGLLLPSWWDAAIAASLIALALAAAALRVRERVAAEQLGQDYTYRVRLALFDHLSSLSPRTLQQRSRGGHLLRFIGDLTALRQWVSLGLARLSVAAIVACFALAALAWVSTPLAISVALVLLCGAGAALLTGRAMRAAVSESRRRRAALAANINEKIAAMSVVQAFGQQRRERRRLARQSRKLRQAMLIRARVIGYLRGLTEATNGIALALVLIMGAVVVNQGQTSAGSVVAALAILGMLTPALRDLGRVHEYWYGYQVARKKIASFMAIEPQMDALPGAPALPVTSGGISLCSIRLDGVFDNLEASAPGGSMVAVVGDNGAGKSTLFNLISRMHLPDSGAVLVDGGDLGDYSLSSIHWHIGMVSPDLPLLRGSIESNVRYRWRDAPSHEVQRVCVRCGVDALAAGLPEGMRTRVGEGGINLSLGQRQRIALARALLGNPKILLLDEVDANLDAGSCALLDSVLQEFQGTVLLISHRLELVLKADIIWHLAGGALLEAGSPDSLLMRPGPTHQLFQRKLKSVA
ncbi:ABC transporter ATP-binding protein [Sedimenticola sp.]|uniref:ABC transporter ATP-binding protein n=1 Tax=Sedimenticola sp. TaxID=1940285 RepID=UPI003D0A6A25